MTGLYTRPLSVYILLGALAIVGVLSGLNLPISLFPSSSQINVIVNIPLGSFSSQQFYEVYGKELESTLQSIKIDDVKVKDLYAEYRNQSVRYRMVFNWGADSDKTINEVTSRVNARFNSAPEEIRRSIRVFSWKENAGFFAVSFYSPLRSLDELYKTLEPIISPMQSNIDDAANLGLFNPNQKEITVTLNPIKLAQFEITTSQVQRAISLSLMGLNGGSLKLGEKDYVINLPKNIDKFSELNQIRVSNKGKVPLFLKDVAVISSGVSKDSRQKFKTSGIESLILFAEPKEGGNIKNMSDQIMAHLKVYEKQWPQDVKFKILVNPSEFINSSIMSVIKEVFLAAFLAVLVLFFFIGSFRNVITAAIEIPMSLLLAFILMRLTGMNLNLISLGGLALSAGMNVDASVVVLENIIRHFENKKSDLSYLEKVKIIVNAVDEVKWPVIASTIASLVVFMPLIFTQGLAQALLGDLAKAVIFSHGLSAIVALILVPTIRLHLISKGHNLEIKSPFEKILKKLENFYASTLNHFLGNTKLQIVTFIVILLLIPGLILGVLPHLKKEVIGKPESDWLIVGVSSPTFTNSKQLESELEHLETDITARFGDNVNYTFTQIQGHQSGNIMLRLKDKKMIQTMRDEAEKLYKNTPTKYYFVDVWNPSELEIPDPPHFQLELTGGDPEKRLYWAQDIQSLLQENGTFDKVRVTPTSANEKEIRISAYLNSGAESDVLAKSEISHLLRVATEGIYAERMFDFGQELPIYLRFKDQSLSAIEHLKALPIGFEGKIVPLSALASVSIQNRPPRLYLENQRNIIVITGKMNNSESHLGSERAVQAKQIVEKFKQSKSNNLINAPSLVEVIPDKDLQNSLNELKWAIIISILLVFLVMMIQLGDLVSSLLVLVAIPLGFIGVLTSLFIFNSSLSLNSGLGTILLNGIAVANSIILVDFIKKLFDSGLDARLATLKASSARMRPILMTSLTTVLGMFPIALGLGEGGKILQPLGIAVCGGLWVSTLLTLYVVPALQYQYLKTKLRTQK